MENSKVEWTTHTFNPWRGCTKVSAGCANCYAETMSHRNPGTLGVWGPSGTRVVAAEAAWREPLKWDRAANAAGERHRVFCASLADVFEDWRGTMTDASGNCLHAAAGLVGGATRSPDWCSESPCDDSPAPLLRIEHVRARLLKLIHLTPNLDWLLLTKRADFIRESLRRTADYASNRSVTPNVRDGAELAHQWINCNCPMPNAWLGTSVENQAAADARHPHLTGAPAAIRFWSAEPLLGPINALSLWEKYGKPGWVIVGGESGPGARPMHVEWARDLVRQCQAAGVPVFVKQLGAHPEGDYYDDREFYESERGLDWPDALNWNHRDGQPPIGSRVALPLLSSKGGDPEEWPEDLRIREFPEVRA